METNGDRPGIMLEQDPVEGRQRETNGDRPGNHVGTKSVSLQELRTPSAEAVWGEKKHFLRFSRSPKGYLLLSQIRFCTHQSLQKPSHKSSQVAAGGRRSESGTHENFVVLKGPPFERIPKPKQKTQKEK